MTIGELLLKRVPSNIIVVLQKSERILNKSEIVDKAGTGYSHTVNVISDMEEEGLVKTQKQGRGQKVKLTPAGRNVAEKIREVKNL